MNKFGANKTEYNGHLFDSKKEARFAHHLDLLRHASFPHQKVVDIEYQVPYQVILNGKKICKYILDFKITYGDGHIEYVDVKGIRKGIAYQHFVLKKKLVEAQYGIEIKEV